MEDVIINQIMINNHIPALLTYSGDKKGKNTIILYHAYLETKEYMLKYAYKFAQMGYLAVSVDLDRHGERDNYNKKFPWQHFYNTMFHTAQEITEVIDYLENVETALCDQVTVLGVSLGGLTALAASVLDKRVGSVATMLASANYPELARVEKTRSLKRFFSDNTYDQETFLKDVDKLSQLYDPYQNIDRIYAKKILMINGTIDMAIPINIVEKFQERLKEKYSDYPSSIKFVIIKGAGHQVSNEMFQDVIQWAKANNL